MNILNDEAEKELYRMVGYQSHHYSIKEIAERMFSIGKRLSELNEKPEGQVQLDHLVRRRKCPICGVGKNSVEFGGNENCFHCDTCWFVQCENHKNEILEMLKTRIEKFYAT